MKIGSKYKKEYDQAKTPYERALSHDLISDEVKVNLSRVHESLKLLELKREVDRLRKKLFEIQLRYGSEVR